MMLPSELIKDEAEFKHCIEQYGKEAVRILTFIKNQWKEQVFTEKAEAKQKALIYNVKNIETLIETIVSANLPTAPISTI
ncbi:hypothetical protein DFV88_24830 [Salmonella enterica subsp. enterica serovar Newport]|nr:hypothetical protein [Salmonella enterica subsp. enterica serovar Newport]